MRACRVEDCDTNDNGRCRVSKRVYDTCVDRVETCRVCGCTEHEACPGGCTWAEPGLCSECVDLAPAFDAIFGQLVSDEAHKAFDALIAHIRTSSQVSEAAQQVAHRAMAYRAMATANPPHGVSAKQIHDAAFELDAAIREYSEVIS